ncbi:MAG: hypothetical protein JW909_00450 [Planctomycetes bacterium]|nr:hypothetical protein [Planctomycetota bacterium]
MKISSHAEPDFETACSWWNDLPAVWTPVGWPDHLFRFNVFWNGMILAQPDVNRRTQAWNGLGVQVAFIPHFTPDVAANLYAYLRQDDGMVTQGWLDHDAPVLWSEWPKDGVLYRHQVFAHVPGGGAIASGDEPLFAWVRLILEDTCSALPLEDVSGFNVIIQAPHVSTRMSMRDNVIFMYGQMDYPRALAPDSDAYDGSSAFRLLEDGGKVRMGLPRGQNCRVVFNPPESDESKPYRQRQPWYRLHVGLDTLKGAHADLLIPMLPCDRDVFDRELALGFDAALAEADAFWGRTPHTAASVSVPETFIAGAFRHSVRLSRVISETDPATGYRCKLSGSFTYADLWTTPMAMDLTMMMDVLGWHDTVAGYLDVFKREQGTVKPPGSAYPMHPGYLSTPAAYKSVDWLSDNGAVLYTICEHALLSGDEAFASRFLDTVIHSCEWIRDARSITGHGGFEKILPPAVATDRGTEIQSVWAAGWNFKGLAAAVRLLRRLDHPRADEFSAEAASYKADFVKALRLKCAHMPSWTDEAGVSHVFVPTALHGDAKDESRHAFYLDAGPLFLVFSGLMDASDVLVQDALAWFRHGPQRKFCRHDSNCWQVPVLDHEISSCEPCYSWNVFISHQAADRCNFLEGMYSLFAGSLSRKTFVSCETRGGVTGNVFSAPLAVFLARLAVIDDQVEENALHLLRLMPSAWLRPGANSSFDNMPTEFGPVTLSTAVSSDGSRLDVSFDTAFRHAPAGVFLHVPPPASGADVFVNGAPARPAGGSGLVRL